MALKAKKTDMKVREIMKMRVVVCYGVETDDGIDMMRVTNDEVFPSDSEEVTEAIQSVVDEFENKDLEEGGTAIDQGGGDVVDGVFEYTLDMADYLGCPEDELVKAQGIAQEILDKVCAKLRALTGKP